MPPLSMMPNSLDLKVPSNAEANPNLLIPRRIMLSCFQRYSQEASKTDWVEGSRTRMGGIVMKINYWAILVAAS
jgi:hypothetical protein